MKATQRLMVSPKFKGNLLKKGNRIIGWVENTAKEGYAYYIGKPSDRTVARFTGKEPLTEDQAKERLLGACPSM